MLKRTISYTDYDGNERTEDLYFNLTQSEITEMELSTTGGFVKMVETITAAKNGAMIIRVFKDIIFKAYGEKSPDGRRFVKSFELSEAFSQTEAYNILFMELATDPDKAAEFFKAIVPQESADEKAVNDLLKK